MSKRKRAHVNKKTRKCLLTMLITAVIALPGVSWKYKSISTITFDDVKIYLLLPQNNSIMPQNKSIVPRNKSISSNKIEKLDASRNCPSNASKLEVEDILCMNLPPFLREYKNPCWKTGNGRLRCLPYFQLIGMDKSGSSDLFNRLTRHPHIFGNSGVVGKEATWWSWNRYGMDVVNRNGKKLKFEDYLNVFDVSTRKINQIKGNQTYHPAIAGDGTPMDMWDFRGWPQIPQNKGLKEPAILTPHLIKHIHPNVKLIVILRNPVDRLYSDFYFLPGGIVRKTPQTFDMAVNRAWTMLQDCVKKNSMRRCLFDFDTHNRIYHQTRLYLGFYSVYMKEWLAVFPREQIFIIRTEDYSENIYLHMKRLFHFLGVGNLSLEEMEKLKITSKEHAHQTSSKKRAGPMLPQTRETLRKIYQPYNEELARMLNDEAYEWLDKK